MISRFSIYLAVFVAYNSVSTINGFGIVNQPKQLPSVRTTISSTTSLNSSGRRRDFFTAVRRVALGAGAFVGWKQTLPVANADDTEATGRIVELQVANLDGKEGETGTIKIQLRPDWAPRGSARFEVRDITVYLARLNRIQAGRVQ